MALIQYAAPWDRQPQVLTELAAEYSGAQIYSPGIFGGLDYSANQNHLIPGTAPTEVVKRWGKSLSYVFASANYLESTRAIPIGSEFTVFCWTEPSALNNGYLRLLDTGYNIGFFLGSAASGNQYNFIVNNASLTGCQGGAQVVGVRNFVLGRFYGSTRELWVDGVLVSSATATAPSTSQKLSVGRQLGAAAGYWSGTIDGVGVLPFAVSDQQIRDIYQSGGGVIHAPQTIWVPVSAGGGSPDVTVAATGVAATGSSGTASPATDKAISGQSATASSGTASPSLANALTGNAATSAGGSVSPSVTIALTGVSATTSVGTVSPSSGVTVALSGVEATTGAGSVGPGAVVALSGQQASGSVGAVSVASPDVTVALSGVSASASVGSVSASGGASVGGGMGFEMGGSKKRRIVKIRWNGYDYTLDRDALPAFLESIEEQAEEKVTKKRNAKKKPAPLAKIVSAPADVMPDLQERIAAVNRSIGALWGAKDDEEDEEILWLMV